MGGGLRRVEATATTIQRGVELLDLIPLALHCFCQNRVGAQYEVQHPHGIGAEQSRRIGNPIRPQQRAGVGHLSLGHAKVELITN